MKNLALSLRRCTCVAVALAFVVGRAHADTRDPAAAQALFDEARKLSAAGRYAEACAKLDESNRLDPGIGTQFHLADCQEKSGRIASAWASFLEVASLARASGQNDREKAALARAAKLEPRLPKLRIEVPEANRVDGLEIRRDGASVGSAQWGTPLPVDPGEHELVATAPGRRTLTQKVRAELGKTAKIELPLLEVDPTATTEATAPPQSVAPAESAAQPSANPSATPVTHDQGAEAGGVNPMVFVLAGVGVVGLGVGAGFAVMASSTNDDSKAECRPSDPNLCSQAGVDMRDDARSQGNIATIGFIAGGAALAGAGLWLVLDSGGSSESATALRARVAATPGGGGVFVSGGF